MKFEHKKNYINLLQRKSLNKQSYSFTKIIFNNHSAHFNKNNSQQQHKLSLLNEKSTLSYIKPLHILPKLNMKYPLNNINIHLFNKDNKSSRNHNVLNHNSRNNYKSLKYLSIDNKLLKLSFKENSQNDNNNAINIPLTERKLKTKSIDLYKISHNDYKTFHKK